MSRSIFERGAAWPLGIQAVETFNTNITFNSLEPQNGVNWRHYPHQCFPWLSQASETDIALNDDRQFLMTFPDSNGVEVPVRITPSTPKLQTSINNEISAIVWRQDWDTYGLPDLVQVKQENGVDYLGFEAHLVPSAVVDEFTSKRDSFVVQAVDTVNRTITLTGQQYYRKRISSAVNSVITGDPNSGTPIYQIGSHWGMQRYMRDQLTSDRERSLDEFKVREYDYAFISYAGQEYKYTQIDDFPTRDHFAIQYYKLREQVNAKDGQGNERFFLLNVDAVSGMVFIDYTDSTTVSFNLGLLTEANQVLLDNLANLSVGDRSDRGTVLDAIQNIESNEQSPSSHVLHMEVMPQNIAVGDSMTIVRRLPYATTMLATTGIMSQYGGYWDFRMRFDRKRRQFSAAFLWSNYIETFLRRYEQRLKETEIDVEEFPGATTPFMNTHRPEANRDGSANMFNYARQINSDPVMSHPEWTGAALQQHQVLIPPDDPDYVDLAAWHDIRVAVCLEGNPLGFPANSVVWYIRTADGQFKFTGGCLMSPEFTSGVIDHLQFFLCNPVDGDFVADMEFFAPGLAATDETLPIKFDVAHVIVNQFTGYEAGGSGLPDPDGQYPNGLGPTPGSGNASMGSGTLPPDNSGTGIVGVPIDPNLPTVIVDGYDEVGTRCDGGKLLEPVPQ